MPTGPESPERGLSTGRFWSLWITPNEKSAAFAAPFPSWGRPRRRRNEEVTYRTMIGRDERVCSDRLKRPLRAVSGPKRVPQALPLGPVGVLELAGVGAPQLSEHGARLLSRRELESRPAFRARASSPEVQARAQCWEVRLHRVGSERSRTRERKKLPAILGAMDNSSSSRPLAPAVLRLTAIPFRRTSNPVSPFQRRRVSHEARRARGSRR
jgi:hypothetical protein